MNTTVASDPEAGHLKAGSEPTIAKISDDLTALKRDFAELLAHVRRDAASGAGDAAGAFRSSAEQLSHKTRAVYADLAADAGCTAKAIGSQVRERPVTSLLIAVGIGVLASRLLPR